MPFIECSCGEVFHSFNGYHTHKNTHKDHYELTRWSYQEGKILVKRKRCKICGTFLKEDNMFPSFLETRHYICRTCFINKRKKVGVIK